VVLDLRLMSQMVLPAERSVDILAHPHIGLEPTPRYRARPAQRKSSDTWRAITRHEPTDRSSYRNNLRPSDFLSPEESYRIIDLGNRAAGAQFVGGQPRANLHLFEWGAEQKPRRGGGRHDPLGQIQSAAWAMTDWTATLRLLNSVVFLRGASFCPAHQPLTSIQASERVPPVG